MQIVIYRDKINFYRSYFQNYDLFTHLLTSLHSSTLLWLFSSIKKVIVLRVLARYHPKHWKKTLFVLLHYLKTRLDIKGFAKYNKKFVKTHLLQNLKVLQLDILVSYLAHILTYRETIIRGHHNQKGMDMLLAAITEGAPMKMTTWLKPSELVRVYLLHCYYWRSFHKNDHLVETIRISSPLTCNLFVMHMKELWLLKSIRIKSVEMESKDGFILWLMKFASQPIGFYWR